MRKDFYIFRHGETELNKQGCMQGSGMDVGLTDNGKVQALALAEKLKPLKLEIIFSSPLKRAVETAEIAAGATQCDLIIKNDLRECFYGVAEGVAIAEVRQKYADVYLNWGNSEVWDIAFPNGESKRAALQRVWRQLEELAARPEQVIGVAIHGGTMGSLLNYLHFDFSRIENCAVIHLVYDGTWHIEGGLF